MSDTGHAAGHRRGLSAWGPSGWDLLRVGSRSRRWFLQAGLSGFAGLTAGQAHRMRAEAAGPGRSPAPKSVILFWLSGGPSHLDTWDPKPDAPAEVRGPFGTT